MAARCQDSSPPRGGFVVAKYPSTHVRRTLDPERSIFVASVSVSTAYFVACMKAMSTLAGAIGNTADEQRFAAQGADEVAPIELVSGIGRDQGKDSRTAVALSAELGSPALECL